jgi:hypothetical protein
MGVLAAAAAPKHKSEQRVGLPAVCASALYLAVVTIAVWHHEPWADEAQGWLLARDAGLVELWTRLLHYEGTPGLWQTLLHVFILLGFPYRALNLLSAALGVAACWLVARHAPFPAPIRLALPFTFFLCYQYAVVARSYSLLPLLLFSAAILYQRSVPRIAAFTGVLCLMAAVSVHGMALSGCIWLALHIDVWRRRRTLEVCERKRVLVAGACYALIVAGLVLVAWPAPDNMFMTRPNWSLYHLVTVSGRSLRDGFAGGWILSAGAIALSLPFLRRGGALLLFLLSLVSLSLVNGIVYSQVWHQGLVFLGWLFAVWVAALRMKPGWSILTSLGIVICSQCWWTVESVRYDWAFPYSGSREAAMYLQKSGIAGQRPFAIGYACVGIEPYFSRNIFANINGGNGPSYWDWSKRNHVNEDSERLATLAPGYVIVGYKGAYERDLWTGQIRRSGYQLVRHFRGNTYWRTAVLEPEAFDLYRRPDR